MADEDSESQEDELLALTSIYDERTFTRSTTTQGGAFSAYLVLPKPFQVKLPREQVAKDKRLSVKPVATQEDFELYDVEYLPPIVLNFQLPQTYPSVDPPEYMLSCKWLTVHQLSKLCKHLDEIWQEVGPGEVILFHWVQFLMDEALTILDINSPYMLQYVKFSANLEPLEGAEAAKEEAVVQYDQRTVQDVGSFCNLVFMVFEYNTQEKLRAFESSTFPCLICFSEKSGAASICFHDCMHVFCKECMAEFFRIQIEDGAVKFLTCPHDKCNSQAAPSQVKELVSAELFAKYDHFLLQRTLDEMADVVYCPRKDCQTAVMLESEASNMGSCPSCNFVFCIYCKHTYHGVSPCKIKRSEFKKLREQYMNGTPEEKALLEKRYGRAHLQKIMDDIISQDWIQENTSSCPSCKANIQKYDGCNKMSCTKCGANFCWLCGVPLSHTNPYAHFNSSTSKCFNKLFVGMDFPDNELIDSDDEYEYHDELFDEWVHIN